MPASILIARVAIVGTTPIAGTPIPVGDGAREVGLHLVTDGSVDGTWTIFTSCKPSGPQDGSEVEISFVRFRPYIDPVDHTQPASQRQFCQIDRLNAAWIWAVFTPTAGAGNVAAYAQIGVAARSDLRDYARYS